MSLIEKLRAMRAAREERSRLHHGWDVELRCPQCGTDSVPNMAGWTPNARIAFGKTATIFANLTCPKCATDLKGVAGEKLIQLFADIPIHPRNRTAIFSYLILTILFLLALGGRVWLRMPVFDWVYPIVFALFMSSRFWFNELIHAARHQFDCGLHAYQFMGLFGRSYCFRCGTCGKLLRLRD